MLSLRLVRVLVPVAAVLFLAGALDVEAEAEKTTGDLEQSFKELFDDEPKSDSIAKNLVEYLEAAPSSKKSRSSVITLIKTVSPDDSEDENLKNMTGNSAPLIRLIKFILATGQCPDGDECSNMTCALINSRPPNWTKVMRTADLSSDRSCSSGKNCWKRCHPCPLPDFCPVPSKCQKCPDKPVCPCGDEPRAEWVPELHSSSSSRDEEDDGGMRSEDRSWFPWSMRPTTTTAKPSPRSTSRRPGQTSTSRSPTQALSTKKVRTSSTTSKAKPLSSTTSKAEPSSSTTPGSDASSSKRPTASSSSKTSKKPTGSSSTTKTGRPSKVSELDEKTETHHKVIIVDGNKTETKMYSTKKTDLEYLLMEDGLKYMIRNKTVVNNIMDSINSLPSRSGGLEGQLANRVLGHFDEDTSRWLVELPGSSKSMTYSTLRRNFKHILGYIIHALIRKKCKHCIKKCKERGAAGSNSENRTGCEFTTTQSNTSTSETGSETSKTFTKTSSTSTMSISKSSDKDLSKRSAPSDDTEPKKRRRRPCPLCKSTCPAPPGCYEYSCKPEDRGCEPATTSPRPSSTSARPSSTSAIPSSTSARPSSTSARPSSTSAKPSSTSARPSTTSTRPTTTSSSPSTSTTYPSSKPATTLGPRTKKPMFAYRDPDFAPNDKTAPKVGEPCDTNDLHDMDEDNQVREEDRFKEFPCRGAICGQQKDCGQAKLNPLTKPQTSEIVNGESSRYGEWPSYVKILISLPSGDKSLCGGVLISNRQVLTAGHCVRATWEGGESPDEVEPHQLSVVLGEHNRLRVDEFEKTRGVEKICSSSKYNDPRGDGARFDFAVVTLNETVSFGNYIQPACLPYKPFPIGKSKCFVIGQGKTRNKTGEQLTLPQLLQKMPVARKTCKRWDFNEHDRSRWCFSKIDDKGDSCSGDSGSPILCLKDTRWHVMGLVSYGSEQCDGSESSGWVAVYTRVPALLEQIHSECLDKS